MSIGVLLVHGIGSSRQGDTVSQWGRAILRGLIRHGAEIEVERSSLKDATTFAFADVCVKPRGGVPFRLLIAESWWAEEFSPPSFMSILWWSFRSLPWTMVSHFDERFRRTGNAFQDAHGPWRTLVALVNVIVELIWLFAGLLLAPIVLVVLVLLAILRIVPYEPLQNGIRGVFQTIAVTIGDSYAFTENPIVQRAITDRVGRDLRALNRRATDLVVIAHSQGAAVAHQVLREQYRGEIAWLVTYGSGLRKLRELLRLQPLGRAEREQFGLAQRLAWMSTLAAVSAAFVMAAYGFTPTTSGAEFVEMALALPFAIAVIGLAVRTALDTIFPDKRPLPPADDLETFDKGMEEKNRRSKRLNYSGLAIIVVVASALCATSASGSNFVSFSIAVLLGLSFTWLMSWRHAAGRLTHEAEHKAKEALVWKGLELTHVARWDDFYANKDPVSNGPLLEFFKPTLGSLAFASHAIANWESPVLDHTTYWSNAAQFVDPIALGLLRLGRGEGALVDMPPDKAPRALVYRILSLGVLVVLPLYLIWDPDVSPASVLQLWPPYEGEDLGALLCGDASLGSKLSALWQWARHGIVLAIGLIAVQTGLNLCYSRILRGRV